VSFNLTNVSIEMTGSKTDELGNQKLMSFGVADQGFKILKNRKDISINMFGITIGTYSTFE